MIILVGNEKGGVGKSTIAVNICEELACSSKDIILVDADRQSTAARWAADRAEHNDLPQVPCVQKYENIRDTLLDLDKRYEYVIVDAAGRDSRELRTGMLAADILLMPFRPSQPDLDVLPNLTEIITQAKDLNPKLKTLAFLNQVPTNPFVKEAEEAQECLEDYPEIKLLNTIIRDRKIFRDAMSEGIGVIGMNNDKAKDEIRNLVKELLENG